MLSANSTAETLDAGEDGDKASRPEETGEAFEDQEASPNGPTFNPALYIQRYLMVADTVTDLCDQAIKDGRDSFKILDLGCSKCSLFIYLKNALADKAVGVTYLAVDKDRDTLWWSAKPAVAPGIWDYTKQRSGPIAIRVLHGDLLEPDDRLLEADVLIMVEVIEHLPIDVVNSKLAAAVLGRLRPRVAVMTTPNYEFNVLFPDFKEGVRKFRHYDHKFEWTRPEFEEWCTTAAECFGYSVTFRGVGLPPPNRSEVGCCTQAAFFTRLTEESEDSDLARPSYGEHFETIEAIDFKWVKPPTPLERLTQNITTALRFYYRTTTEDAASDVDDSWTEPGDGDTVGESSKFPVTALSSFVEHMEEEEGLQLIRKIAVDNGFRLSEDSQYVMCCDTDEEEEEDFRFYEQPQEGEKETSAVLPDFDSDWNWPSE